MLPNSKQIKKTAKEVLGENYFICCVTCVIVLFSQIMVLLVNDLSSIVFGNNTAVLILAVLESFVMFPLFLGAIKYFIRLGEGVCDMPVSVFCYFRNKETYLKTMSFVFAVLVRLILSAFIFFLPSIILFILSKPFVYEKIGIAIPLWSPILSSVSGFVSVIMGILYVIFNLKYYLTFYLFAMDDGFCNSRIIKMSKTISSRTKIDFIFLSLSMILYILASIFFVPLIFTLPLFLSVYIVHSKCAVIQYNNTIDNISKNSSFCSEM